MPQTRRHFIVPDTQVKPKVPTAHVEWAGKYIADKRPDVIVVLGDWWDMPSLSVYDSAAKKIVNGYTVTKDYRAGCDAMERFMAPWCTLKNYRPRIIFTKGNHEHRIDRYLSDNPENDTLPDIDRYLRNLGWEVHPFLHPVTVDRITYCHYFCKNSKGAVHNSKNGQSSAFAQCKNEMRSTVAGHKQGLDSALYQAGDRRVRGIIAGSFYQHHEEYKSPQGNDHWRGCLLLNDVRNGDYELCEVSLGYLRRKYR